MARDYYDESKPKKKKKETPKPQKVAQSPSVTNVDKKAKNSTFLGGGATVKKVEQRQTTSGSTTSKSQQTTQRRGMTDAQYQKTYGEPRRATAQRNQTMKPEPVRRTTNHRLTAAQTQKMYGTTNPKLQTAEESRREREERRKEREERRLAAQRQKSGLNDQPTAAQKAATDRALKNTLPIAKESAKGAAYGHLTTLNDIASVKYQGKGKSRDEIYDPNLVEKSRKQSEERVKKFQAKTQETEDAIQKLTKNAKGLEKAYYGAVESGTGMLTDIGVGAITGTGQVGSLAAMFSRTYGSTRGKAQQEGATQAEDRAYAAAQAAKEVGTELMFPGVGLARGYAGKQGLKLADTAANILTKNLRGKAADLGGAGVRLIGGVLEENAEEVAGWGLDPLIKEITYGKKARTRNAQQAMKERSNALRAEIQNEDDARAAAAYLSSDDFFEQTVNAYREAGLSKKDAEEVADRMRDYLTASLTGDTDSMEQIEDEVSKKVAGSKKLEWDFDELKDTIASTTLLTAATGLPGTGMTAVKGAALRDQLGADGVRALANTAIDFEDGEMSLKAKAMKARLDSGNELTSTQVYDLQVGMQEQIRKDTQREESSRRMADKRIKSDNLLTPYRQNENGGIDLDEATEVSYREHVSKAKDIIDGLTSETKESLTANEKVDGSKAIAGFQTGVFTIEDANTLNYSNTTVRAAFEEATGVDLGQYVVKNKDGSVNIPATNTKTKDALFAMAADNLVKSAQAETQNWMDNAKGQVVTQVSARMGASGSAVLQQALDDVDERDRSKYMMTANATDMLYQAARNMGTEWESIAPEATKMFPGISESKLKMMYEAGLEDRAMANDKARGRQVRMGQALSEMGEQETATGKVYIDSEVPLKGSVIRTFTEIAKNLGADIHFVDYIYDANNDPIEGANGSYDPNTNTFYLNVTTGAETNIGYIFMHETTHYLKRFAPEQYQALENLVRERWFAFNPSQMQDAIARKIEAYKRVTKGQQVLTEEQALEEIIADASHDFINDPEFAKQVAEEDMGLAKAVLDSIRNALRMLRRIFASGSIDDDTHMNSLFRELDIMVEAEKLWLDAYKVAVRNSSIAAVNEWQDNANSYSISEGKKSNSAEAKWERGEKLTKAKFNSFYSAHKLTYGRATKENIDDVVEKIKTDGFISTTAIANVVPASINDYVDPEKPNLTQSKYGAKEGDVVMFVPNKYVDLKNDIIKNGYKPRDYEIVEVERDYQPYYELYSKAYDDAHQTRFSVSEPVERVKDLIAVHNLKPDDIRNTFELGGFPMPSIAVTKDSMGHDEYGDITLMFHSDTIDPEFFRSNQVFGGDAWTPTFPSIAKKVSRKVADKVDNRLREILGLGQYDYTLGDLRLPALDDDNLTNALRYNEPYEAFKNDEVFQIAYLKNAKNFDIAVPTKEGKIRSFDKQALEYLDDNLPELTYNDIYDTVDHTMEYEPAVRQARKDYYESKGGVKLKALAKHLDEKMGYSDVIARLEATIKYRESGIPEVVDRDALKKILDENVDQEGYKAWIDDLFNGIIEKTGIRNNKDMFTASGNRRSWESLHDPVTLENVVKVMRAELAAGGTGIFGSNPKGAAQKQYKSLDEIRADEDRLQSLPEEEYKARSEEAVGKMSEVCIAIAEHNPKRFSNSFGAALDVGSDIAEILNSTRKRSTIQSKLKRDYLLDVTDEQMDDLMEAIDAIANLPTGYFEAKPRRAVGFDEVKAAIIPQNTDEDIKDGLESQGIPYYEYDPEVDGDRKKVVNRAATEKNLRFSISESTHVMYTPKGVEVVQNPTDNEYRDMREEILSAYPWLRGTGEPLLRKTYDESGNEYYWNAFEAMHRDVEPYINKEYNTRTSQQWKWYERPDKDDYPIDYSALMARYSIAAELDDAYMDAVNSGNMEEARRLVGKAGKLSGFGTTLYHGTRSFGFTEIRTTDLESKSDGGFYEWSPFFASDSLEVAQTYSSQDEIKRISEASEPFDEDRFDDEYNDAVNSLVNAINEFAGIYNYMDYSVNPFIAAYKELQTTSHPVKDITEDLIDNVSDIISELAWSRAVDYVEAHPEENISEDEYADELQESIETNSIWVNIDIVNDMLRSYDEGMYGNASSGNYELLANTDNMMQVDAKGHRWNDIPFDAIPEKRGYYRTRQLAEIARDEGYDGIQIANLFDDGGHGKGKRQQNPATIYIFFKPENQVKSADPVTYAEDGSVIPLSERFDPTNNDIRYSLPTQDSYGDVLSDGQMDFFKNSQARNKDGKLIRFYHYTDNGRFTIFDPSFSDDHRSLFFTDDWTVGLTYTSEDSPTEFSSEELTNGDEDRRAGYYPVYLNLTNPLIVDADNSGWNMVLPKGYDRMNIEMSEWDGQWDVDYRIAERGPNLDVEWGDSESERFDSKEEADTFIVETFGQAMLDYLNANDNYFDDIYSIDEQTIRPVPETLPGLDTGETSESTRQIAERAYYDGYDGVIFRNLVDIGGAQDSPMAWESTIAVAFTSNQVKLTDNKNPSENPDIRFSITDDEESKSRIAYNDAMDDSYELLAYYETQISNVNPETYDVSKAFKEEDVVRFLDALKAEDSVPSEDAKFEEDRVRRARSKEDFFNNVNAKWNDRWTTEGEVLKISSVKRDITNLVKGAMANSDSDAQYRNEIVRKTLLDARTAYQLMKQDRTELASYLLYHSAQRMIDGLEFIRDDTAFKEYKEIRDFLRGYRINAPEEYWDNVEFNDFRKEYYGRLRIGKGNSNIEDVYKDCQDRWPHLFNESEREKADNLGDSPEDLLLHIGVVVDSNVTPFMEAYSSEEATSLAFDLADQLYEIIANGDRVVSLADSYKERFDAKTKAMKARHAEAILRERRIREEGIKKERLKFREYKETQKEKKLHTKRFEGIKDKYDELTKRLLTNTKDKHIPEQYKRELAGLLKAFDLQTVGSKKREARTGYKAKNTIKLEAMRTALENIEANSQLFHINDSVTDIIKDLLGQNEASSNKQSIEGKTIDELSASELTKIDKLLGALLHEFNNYEKVRVGVKKQQAADIGHAQNNISLEHAELFGAGRDYQNTPGWVDKILNLDEMTAAYLFKRIDPNKEGLGLMYGEIRKSFDKYVRNQNQLNEWMEEIVGKYHNKGILWNKYGSGELTNWRSDNYAHNFALENGQTIRLTIAQMMSVACLANRQQAYDHMTGNGVVISPVTFNAKILSDLKKKVNKALPVRLTDADIKNIVTALTPEQRQVANKLQELMATKMAEWGNEASMNVIGIRLFEDPDYFPIRSDRGGLTKDLDPNQFEQAIRNFGFTKAVQPGAKNAIMIDDIFDVVTEHCNNMNLYNSYTEAMNDFMKVYNYREARSEGEYTVEQALSHAFSQKAPTFIMQFMRDLNGNVSRRASGIEDAYNSLLGNAKKAAVFANLRVAAQQPTAITRAFAVIDPKYMKGIKIEKGAMEEMFEHCPIALWKSWGYYDINMGKSIEDVMMNNGRWLEDKATDLYGALDNVTWTAIWQMVKAEMKDTHPNVKVGTDEYWDLCNERMSEIVDLTQVVDSPMHRSHAMRDKGFLKKTATAFMAEPTLTFNMIRDGWISTKEAWQNGDRKKATAIAARTSSVALLQAATVAGAAALVDALRKKNPDKDDDDDKFLHLWWVNALENFKDELKLWNKIYFIKDIASIFDGWENANLALQGIQKFALGYRQLTGDPYARSKAAWYENMADGIGYMWGIPIKTMRTGLSNAMKALGLSSPLIDNMKENLDAMAEGKSSSDEEKAGFIGSLISDNSDGMFGKLLTTSTKAETDEAEEAEQGEDRVPTEESLPDNLTDEQKKEIIKSAEKRSKKAKSAEEQKQLDYDTMLYDALKASSGLEGEEYNKKVYNSVANGLKGYIADGDYTSIGMMRTVIEQAGGDTEYFDKRVLEETKTAYKKSLVYDPSLEERNNMKAMYRYMMAHGMTQDELSSEILYKSDLAKDMKVAYRLGDNEMIYEAMLPLVDAGMTKTEFERLYENRNRMQLDKYDGRYKDKLKSTGNFIWPTDGQITSYFGYRNAPTAGASSNHPAIDIGAPMGTDVVAADGGVVIYAGTNGGYGNSVGIKHDNGMVTYYNHLSAWNVNVGDTVAQGQQIANVGSTGISTGPHLDFKILDANGEPVDPLKYLASRS